MKKIRYGVIFTEMRPGIEFSGYGFHPYFQCSVFHPLRRPKKASFNKKKKKKKERPKKETGAKRSIPTAKSQIFFRDQNQPTPNSFLFSSSSFRLPSFSFPPLRRCLPLSLPSSPFSFFFSFFHFRCGFPWSPQ